jgi:RND family efflux transporter MFP subunit
MRSSIKVLGIIAGLVLLNSCGKKSGEVKPERKDLTEMVFASGVLEADDQNNLTAQTDGYLIKLDFKEGDMVDAGQLLAVIDNNQNIINSQNADVLHAIAETNALPSAPALQQISANIVSAKAKLKLDQQQADRYKNLYASNSVSKLEYENAQLSLTTSQAQLDALQQQFNNQKIVAEQQEVSQRSLTDVGRILKEQNQVKAIIAGKIYEKKKQLGDYVRKGDVIAVVANPNLIYAKLNVDETNMAKIKLDQVVDVQLNTNKSRTYKAKVHEILPTFDETSQSFLIKAYFTDKLDFLIVGTQLEANILIGEKKQVLVIPRKYLGYGNKVMLKDKKEKVIETGIISTDWVEVTGGLSENDVLIENK